MEYLVTPEKRKRRRHTAAFKHQVVEACQRPGTSVAAVALAHGLNANLLRRWLKIRRDPPPNGGAGRPASAAGEDHRAILPVVVASSGGGSADAIRISIQRRGTTIEIAWPITQAKVCSEWLRELLP